MADLKYYLAIAVERKIKDGLDRTTIKEAIREITPSENEFLSRWEALVSQIQHDYYPQYTTSELAIFLGLKTGFSCPLTPVSTVFSGVKGKKYLLAYYVLKGYNVVHYDITPTPEQFSIIEYTNGVKVINAGPGTGKTETVVKRAMRWKSESVLIVSYSNEAVKEIYRRIKQYPSQRGTIGFKEFKKASGEPYSIVVSTVDSIAWQYSGKASVNESSSSHESAIADATSSAIHRKPLPFRHIIVDEAQDIDNARGQFLLTLYASGMFSSLTIFGDPRQRISSSGEWYTKLWSDSSYTALTTQLVQPILSPIPSSTTKTSSLFDQMMSSDPIDTPKSTPTFQPHFTTERIIVNVEKIGFTISHRFKNQALLNLHNSLSSQRQNLHIPLTSSQPLPDHGRIRCYNIGHHSDEQGLKGFSDYIRTQYIDTKFCSLSDICVIIPSIGADNETSRKAQRICAIFKDSGLNCYTRSEGSFIPNGILITTIHSVKGKEFSVVILYCMSEFPKFFPQIPYDNADSLIYVANTRAKKEIIYLCNETFLPPRGVGVGNLETFSVELKGSPAPEIEASSFGVSEIVKCHGWSRLIQINQYTVNVASTEELPLIPKINIGNPRLNGVLVGLIMETLVTGTHLPLFQRIQEGKIIRLPSKDYNKASRDGFIINGIWSPLDDKNGYVVIASNTDVNAIRDEELVRILPLLSLPLVELTFGNWCSLAQIYDFICGDHMNSRYDLSMSSDYQFSLSPFLEAVTRLKHKFGDYAKAEVNVNFGYVNGACDLVFTHAIVELKYVSLITNQHRQQVTAYNACFNGRFHTYVYNLQDGKLEHITSPQSPLLWKYMLDSYVTIKNHTDIVNIRKNNLIAKGIPPKQVPSHTYVADTEFDRMGIFDYALVNLEDPFCSIVQPLYSMSSFASEWISQHHSFWSKEELNCLFSQARKYPDLDDLFRELPRHPNRIVKYYQAQQDVILSNYYGFGAQDLNPQLASLATANGCSIEAAVRVRLGEIYDLLSIPLDFQRHLHQHSALTDALLLYEMFHLGYLS